MTGCSKKGGLRLALATTALGGLFALATPAAAKGCSELANLHLDKGKVTSAELVAAGAFKAPPSPFPAPPGVTGSPFEHLPAFCRVQATLTPTPDSDIKVEVWMPASGWNGKYVGLGNGVWAGQLSITQIPDPLSRGYAVATTDTGHTGTGMSGDFAVGHPEKLIDFGYRAIHLTAVTAKQAIEAFYGKPAEKSYWTSCSTGGRQGLMEAYRYPADYDFISAMAPANPMTDLMTQSMFAGFWPRPPQGEQLTATLLGLLHKAVVKECDKLDGLEDGIIANPEACHYDPAKLQCKPGEKDNCLSAGQVAVAREIYDGLRDPKTGAQILPGWPRGSELQLAMLVSGPAPFPVALTYYKLLVHGDDPNWDWKTMDYSKEVYAARRFGAKILDVPSDGLSPFFARGGRLLMSHGWTDGLIPANNSVKFYRGLYHSIPLDEAQNQLRLFMIPGMNHCAGGEGATEWDPLGVIEHWDASGQAPDRIVAKRGGPGGFPGAPKLPPISRPLCPYPLIPTYTGKGSEGDAANFTCAAAPE
jgi:feruloyl esterase